MSQSREKWKQRAMIAEKELRLLHASADGQKKREEIEESIEVVTANRHHYDVETVQKAVQQTIDSGTSLRGVEKNLKLDVYEEEFSTPSFSSVRNWLGRIGLYELKREKEYRTDWVFII